MRRKPFAYASIIEALTVGLYPNRKHVLREFIQNAYDGLSDLRRDHPTEEILPVEVSVMPPSLIIADKGIGMDSEKMHEYRFLGYSEKLPGAHAGFRGIGKFSPVSACERIVVRSSKLGVAKKYEVIIEAAEMLGRLKRERNPSLEEVLEKHSSIQEAVERASEHYTFVEFYGIKQNSQDLLDPKSIRDYLTKVAPVPLNPQFSFATEVTQKLQQFVPHFLSVDIRVNGENTYKPLLENYSHPEFETIYADDSFQQLVAFSWYCGNLGRGQFREPSVEGGANRRHPHSGLTFRLSNFAIGDQLLTRRALWNTTPERAYYFFGEIHVLAPDVRPTSDRDNFEENESRELLYMRCKKISHDLNIRANLESTERRFGEVVDQGQTMLSTTEAALRTGALERELRDDTDYEIQKLVEDLDKRLRRSSPTSLKNKSIVKRAKQVISRGEKVRRSLKQDGDSGYKFVDIKKDLKLHGPAAAVYDAVVSVLREEFGSDKERFTEVLRKIHTALRKGV